MSPEFAYIANAVTIIAAVIVGIGGSARIIRVVTGDDFPPTVWLAARWVNLTKGGSWSKIVECLWCLSPYVVAANLAWFLLSEGHDTTRAAWWIFNGWLAASYAASWVVFHDEDD
jgi:hypothetical protein